jgi:UDP-N-acetylglucosamine/UDP-N-acetylgalactosamine diphosphorylase
MAPENIFALLQQNRQDHILKHYQLLEQEKKKELLLGLERLDLTLVFRLQNEFPSGKKAAALKHDVKPAPILSLPRTREEEELRAKARLLGERLIRENRVAVLIVAGGQGSRLGFPGPKGKFPITPVKKKPLFQLFAESLRALEMRYGAAIPLLIMTSEENGLETREFFETHSFWGLEKNRVHFFDQALLPTLTLDGKLVLKDDTHLLANPDGHGGSLKALSDSGLLKDLLDTGYEELFYCQIDNPLVKIADPVFLGLHRQEGAEISTKVVRRGNVEEKVGIYGMVNGKAAIVEYSDFPPEEYRASDEKGNLRYWAGNTAIHVFSLSFVKRLNRQGFALPYHRAVKDVVIGQPDGSVKKFQTVKFETFVFDSIPLAKRACCLEVLREEEFSPVKNQQGNDSPETARASMNVLFTGWLKETGANVAPGVQVEVGPLFALDKEELIAKLGGKEIVIDEDRYFG